MTDTSERDQQEGRRLARMAGLHPISEEGFALDIACSIAAARAESAAAEREQCAKIAETAILVGEPWGHPEIFEASLRQLVEATVRATAKEIAARIRSDQ